MIGGVVWGICKGPPVEDEGYVLSNGDVWGVGYSLLWVCKFIPMTFIKIFCELWSSGGLYEGGPAVGPTLATGWRKGFVVLLVECGW